MTRTVTLLIPILVVPLAFAACHQKGDGSGSQLLMDLGASGNQTAIDAYTALDTSPCSGAQAIVTGFDDFDGSHNITRLGLEKLAVDYAKGGAAHAPPAAANQASGSSSGRATATSTAAAAAAPPSPAPGGKDENGAPLEPGPQPNPAAAANEDNATTVMKRVVIGGVDVCLVTVPVNPIAPALLQKVAHDSGALRVYDLGERDAGSLVEAGGLNATLPGMTYYNADGSVSSLSNSSTKVIESSTSTASAHFTWNQYAVATATHLQQAADPRALNNYICNAVGYVLAATIGSSAEYLPGLILQPLPQGLVQGFMHLQPSAGPTGDPATDAASAQMVETAVVAMLGAALPSGTTTATQH